MDRWPRSLVNAVERTLMQPLRPMTADFARDYDVQAVGLRMYAWELLKLSEEIDRIQTFVKELSPASRN